MLNAWQDDIDPSRRNANGDWLSPLLTYQGSWGPSLWAGPQGISNQGEYQLYNPSSMNSPYRDSGLPGTYKSSDSGKNTFGAGPAVGPSGMPGAAGAAGAGGVLPSSPVAGSSLTGALTTAPSTTAGIAGTAAAGGTGVSGMDWLDRLSGFGELFGNTASQRAGERNLEALANAANYRTQQDAMLRAYQLAMLGQQQLPGQMSRANLMANPPADLKLSHPRATMPNIQGGITMGNLTSGSSRALGEAMQKTALLQGLKGYDTSGMVMQPPTYPKGNWLDTLLNAGGFAGGAANAWKYGTGKT